MTTRTDTGPTPVDISGLDPAAFRDSCDDCMALHTDRAAYTAIPEHIRPGRGGLIARYRHTCGRTWVCGWTMPIP